MLGRSDTRRQTLACMEAAGIRVRVVTLDLRCRSRGDENRERVRHLAPIERGAMRHGGTRPRCPGVVDGRPCGGWVAELCPGRHRFRCRRPQLPHQSRAETVRRAVGTIAARRWAANADGFPNAPRGCTGRPASATARCSVIPSTSWRGSWRSGSPSRQVGAGSPTPTGKPTSAFLLSGVAPMRTSMHSAAGSILALR